MGWCTRRVGSSRSELSVQTPTWGEESKQPGSMRAEVSLCSWLTSSLKHPSVFPAGVLSSRMMSQTIPSHPSCLFDRMFYHSNKNEARTPSKVSPSTLAYMPLWCQGQSTGLCVCQTCALLTTVVQPQLPCVLQTSYDKSSKMAYCKDEGERKQ